LGNVESQVTLQLLAKRVVHKELMEYLQAVHDTLKPLFLHYSNRTTIVLYGHEMRDNFSENHSNLNANTRGNSIFQT
jgi:hypothetical protein